MFNAVLFPLKYSKSKNSFSDPVVCKTDEEEAVLDQFSEREVIEAIAVYIGSAVLGSLEQA